MYNHENTDLAVTLLVTATVVVLIAGIVGGLVIGGVIPDIPSVFAESGFGFVYMLCVWIVSAVVALTLYAKAVQLQIADEMLGEVKKLEQPKPVVKTVTRTVIQKQPAESEPAENTNE
ncbi:MAG: hypothetical protein IJE10_05405 [Clostridia bacterium]|nr:hypothetical protein [Clostridia bacterium]